MLSEDQKKLLAAANLNADPCSTFIYSVAPHIIHTKVKVHLKELS